MSDDAIRKRYRRLVFLTWFLTLDLIMFGAFVRLADAGLGCPDWPGCYGKFSPIGANALIQQAYEAMPWGPVSHTKAWIEMLHRYVGATLGLLIIAIVYMATRYRSLIGRSSALAWVTLVAVCVQGAFGAWTVTHKLMPVIVTTHLLGGMTVLSLLTWLAARERQPNVQVDYSHWHPLVLASFILLFIQIALGGWVSTNYAALACMDFPLCHGQVFPPMDFASGYSLNRDLGMTRTGDFLPREALTAIHWTHRNFAFVVFFIVGATAWKLRDKPALQGPARLLLLLLCLQLFTGLTTIFFKWPLLIAVLHNGGAAGMILCCILLLVRTSRSKTFVKE